ncbi:MAG: hypothetical protein JJT82_02515 [Legionellaceae bacterium]|nr:hypothetical protein [Legionellaceae bacterium]
MMLIPIKVSGRFFSEKRHQITKLNELIQKINTHVPSNLEKAKEYASKLLAYQFKLTAQDKAHYLVEQWLIENSPPEILKKIEGMIENNRLRERITSLSASARLPDIYSDYDGKDSFRTLIEKQLRGIDEEYEVISLGGNNNPVVQVKKNDAIFVLRFLRMNCTEEELGYSPRITRELLEGVKQIPQPYRMEEAANDRQEITYIEYSPYYQRGNLEDCFEKLRHQQRKKIVSPTDFYQAVLHYTIKIVEFLMAINEKNIWFTDLKPSNILLNEDDEIVISDIKGLLVSPTEIIASNRANTTSTYHQSTVYTNKNTLNLKLLQCQTLATTIYQLVCGTLPEQVEADDFSWHNKYTFKQKAFQTEQGAFFKTIIKRLNCDRSLSMRRLHGRLATQLADITEPHITLDEPLQHLSPMNRYR